MNEIDYRESPMINETTSLDKRATTAQIQDKSQESLAEATWGASM
jgi:hypothetical protein